MARVLLCPAVVGDGFGIASGVRANISHQLRARKPEAAARLAVRGLQSWQLSRLICARQGTVNQSGCLLRITSTRLSVYELRGMQGTLSAL